MDGCAVALLLLVVVVERDAALLLLVAVLVAPPVGVAVLPGRVAALLLSVPGRVAVLLLSAPGRLGFSMLELRACVLLLRLQAHLLLQADRCCKLLAVLLAVVQP